MFVFSGGANPVLVCLVWLGVLAALVLLNEVTRGFKAAGFLAFFILPVVLTILWLTVLKDILHNDWFHMVKVYSATIACVGFWCIRYVHKTNKLTGEQWQLSNTKFAMFFPPAILALNILEAVLRDIELGRNYSGMGPTWDEGASALVIGGSWNYMNAAAGIFSIFIITGFTGICLRKETKNDRSKSLLWPDMLWFYIIPYTFWNFAYVYNALPHRAWYNGLALLLAPIICAFTTSKGSWVQHRGHTLALWCYFALSCPQFLDESKWTVVSSYNPTAQFIVSLLSMLSNGAVVCYMIYKIKKTGRNPYKGELYTNLKGYQEIKAMAEPSGPHKI
ncbi:MAG: DUF5692 family protein [Treponema sp.]|nr:DUF5692 family protein [Treponema sp.]